MAKSNDIYVMLRMRPDDKARLKALSKRVRIPMAAIVYNATMHYVEENETASDRLDRLVAVRSGGKA